MAALRLTSFTLPCRGGFPLCRRGDPVRGLPSLRLAAPRRRGDQVKSRAATESYASALSEVAAESDTLDQTVSGMEKLEKIFTEEAIIEFFNNPIVPRDEKFELIDEIAKSCKLQPHVVNFLNVVVDNFRVELMSQIVEEFENAYNALTGTKVATIVSVVQLELQDLAQIVQHIQKMTGANNVRLKTQINPELIAGFTVLYGHDGSSLIDTSVQKQIKITSEFEMPAVTLSV